MKKDLLFLPLFILMLLELYHFSHYPWVRKLLTDRSRRVKSSTPKPRQLKPKSEKDCPQCQDALLHGERVSDTCPHVPTPWNRVKGKGGKKKTIRTQGYFCSNPACAYYLITDETIHALVGDGSHGKYEDIQDLLCQACHKKFTVRRHTVLYRLKTHSATVRLVLNLLALGTDISAIEEALNLRESTIRTWLCRSGEQGRKLHRLFLVNLDLVHVQLDELWANVKQAQQEVWVWTVCDAKTKLIPVVQLGTRTQDMTYSVVHELKTRLAPGCVPAFSSDGLKHYFYALTAHFGEWFQSDDQAKPTWLLLASFAYAQVIKHQRRFRLIDLEQRMIWGLASEYTSRLKAVGLSGRINTSFVERANLTIRQCVSKLTRRTWGTAQFPPELTEHLFWWLAYYHFCRYHESLRVRLEQPIQCKGKQRPIQYRRMTPAIAAGLTHQRWSVWNSSVIHSCKG